MSTRMICQGFARCLTPALPDTRPTFLPHCSSYDLSSYHDCLLDTTGADKAKRDLKVLKGRCEVVNVLKTKGLPEVVNLLGSLLPPLLTPGAFFHPLHFIIVNRAIGHSHSIACRLLKAECSATSLHQLVGKGKSRSNSGSKVKIQGESSRERSSTEILQRLMRAHIYRGTEKGGEASRGKGLCCSDSQSREGSAG